MSIIKPIKLFKLRKQQVFVTFKYNVEKNSGLKLLKSDWKNKR